MVACRKINEADISSVRNLLLQLGYKKTEDELNKIVDKINNDTNSILFIAQDDVEGIVGCVHVLIETRLAEGTFGEIVSLVVDEKLRGNGIGKMLINEAVTWLRNTGMYRLRIRCNAIRKETHKFYADLGFIEEKSQKVFEKIIE